MRYTVVFHDLGDKVTEEITSDRELTCQEAAGIVLERSGRQLDARAAVIWLIGENRVYPDTLLKDGDKLTIYRILGGG